MTFSGWALLVLGLSKLIPAIGLLHSGRAETDNIAAMFFLFIDSTIEVIIGASLILNK